LGWTGGGILAFRHASLPESLLEMQISFIDKRDRPPIDKVARPITAADCGGIQDLKS
jgi:hypothetical protein